MRLIDIEDMALLKTVSCGGLSAKKLWKRIKEQPTIDAVEVVRCKDCKHHEKFLFDDSKVLCWVHDTDIVVSQTDYCSYGERREDGEA